jgi:hypothetical protein
MVVEFHSAQVWMYRFQELFCFGKEFLAVFGFFERKVKG